MKCRSCRWWDEEAYAGPSGEFGLCRGSSPTPNIEGLARWPITGDEDFCGQWTPQGDLVQLAEHEEAVRTLDSPAL